MTYNQPDYEMDDDCKPRPINLGIFHRVNMLENKFTDFVMQGQIGEDSNNLHNA
jgi:hypothetical protein